MAWLPGSGRVQDARPLLERYGADFCPDEPGSRMQVRLPLQAWILSDIVTSVLCANPIILCFSVNCNTSESDSKVKTQQNKSNITSAKPKDKTALYLSLGIVGILIVFGIFIIVKIRKKKRK